MLKNCIEIAKLDDCRIINKIYSNSDNQKEYTENFQTKLLKFIGGEEEIVVFEREIIPDYHHNIYIYPIIERNNKIKFLSYPIVFSVKHDLKLGEFEKLIFDKLKHLLNNDALDNNKSINRIIDINIMHSSKYINKGIFKTSKEYIKCRFCQQSCNTNFYCNLYLSFSKTDTVKKLIEDFNRNTNSEPLILLARSKYFDINKKVYDDFNFEENDIINKKREG